MATTLTPAEELRLILAPPTTQGQLAIERDPDMRRLSNAYKAALQKPTQRDVNIALGPIIQELNNRGTFTYTPDVVFESLQRESFGQPPVQVNETSQETPPPQGFDMTKLIPRKETAIGGAGTTKRDPEDILRDIQEEKAINNFQSLLTSDEFQKLISSGANDKQLLDAIDRFYSQHFDAQTLLGSQYDMVRKHAFNLPGLSEQKENIAKFDAKRAQEEAFLKRIKTSPENELTQEEKHWKKAQEERDAYAKTMKSLMLSEVKRLREDPKNPKILTSVQKRIAPLARNAFKSEWGLVNNWALAGISDIFTDFNYRAFGDSLIEEGGQLSSTTTTIIPQQQTSEPDIAIQQQGGGQQQGTGPGGISRGAQNAGQLGRKAGRSLRNKVAKKTEEELAEAAVKQGGRSLLVRALLWPWTWVILLILLLVFLLILLIFFLMSSLGGATTNAAPTPTPTIAPVPIGGGGNCSGVDCKNKLAAFGVFTSGSQELNGDPYGRVKLLYGILSKVLQSPSAYGKLLGLPNKAVSISFANGGCAGHADHSGFVFLYGFGSCGTDVAQFMALHELGHVIAFRNPSLYNKYLNTISFSRMRALPTYNCQFDYGIGPYPAECWADTVGEYVVYSYYRNTVGGRPVYYTGRTFPSFPSQFSDFYNFAKSNIYKGATY